MKLVMYAMLFTPLIHAADKDTCRQFYVVNLLDTAVQVDPFAMLGGKPITATPGQTVTYTAPTEYTIKPYVTFGSTTADGKHIFIAPHINPPLLLDSATLEHNDYVSIEKDAHGRHRITYAKHARVWPTFACYTNQPGTTHPLLSEHLDGATMSTPDVATSLGYALDAESARIMQLSITCLRLAAIWSQGRLKPNL